jgi:hypothetical protein
VLILEKTDPHMTEILEVFVEIAYLSSVKVGELPVDIFEIDDDKEPNTVDKFQPLCVDNVLNMVDIPVVVIKATELIPVVRFCIPSPMDVEVLEIWLDVFNEILNAVEEIPSFRSVSAEFT